MVLRPEAPPPHAPPTYCRMIYFFTCIQIFLEHVIYLKIVHLFGKEVIFVFLVQTMATNVSDNKASLQHMASKVAENANDIDDLEVRIF